MLDDMQPLADIFSDDGDMPVELATLERRLTLDGSLWRTDVPSDAELAALAATLPGDIQPTESDDEAGGPIFDELAAPVKLDVPCKPYRRPPALIAAAAAMIVVLLLALVLTTFTHSPAHKGAATGDGTVTATADGTSTATDAPTATGVPTSTVQSGGGTGGVGGTDTPPAGGALTVTGLTLSVDRTSVNGICQDDNFFNFTLTIAVASGSQGGIVDYTVIPSDGTVQQISSNLEFGNVDTTETASFGEDIPARDGDGTTHWIQVRTTSPNAVTSQKISFSATCVRQVTSVTTSVTPSVWNAPCPNTLTFNFTVTVQLTPGPPVTLAYSLNESQGFGAWHPPTYSYTNFTGDSLASSWQDTLYAPGYSGGANGTYWQSITVTSPNSITSNQATITENC